MSKALDQMDWVGLTGWLGAELEFSGRYSTFEDPFGGYNGDIEARLLLGSC